MGRPLSALFGSKWGVTSIAIGQVAADPYISASAGVHDWLETHVRLDSNVWKTLGVIQ